MAEETAHYSFLPWLRQGLNSQIIETDNLASGAGTAMERAQLSVELTVHADAVEGDGGNDQTINKVINVLGPGDILNISERVIVRVNPPKNVGNYEDNNLAYIEFYEEDFLWRYTPASPNAANPKRLRPWLALIVLKNDEFTEKQFADSLPFISVANDKFNDVFGNPEDTWAWAHVHFNELLIEPDVSALQARVTNELNEDADSALSRLLCPRKLLKNTSYTACVIPAFETGRRTGLGIATTGVPAQESSWIKNGTQQNKPRGFDFPVYYQWTFHTGIDGDFESLVSKLKPIVMEPESGMMPMDVQEVGYGMDQKMESPTMGMEAALRPPSFEKIRKDFPKTAGETAVFEQLRDFLNLSPSINRPQASAADKENPFYEVSLTDDPMIVPPVYGAWHGMAEDLETGVNFPWLLELNLDFRNRAAAGLGTKVIQKRQEILMNKAWQQVGKINDANKKINEALLSKLVNNAFFKKHLIGTKTDKFVRTTGAMQHLLWNESKDATVNNQIEQSVIPLATQSATFQKLTRQTSRTKSFALNKNIISNFNKADNDATAVTAAKLKTAPSAALSLTAATQLVDGAIGFYAANAMNVAKDLFFDLLNNTTVNSNNLPDVKNDLQTALAAKTEVSAEVANTVTSLINDVETYSNADDAVKVTVKDSSYKTVFDNFSGGRTYANATVMNSALTMSADAVIAAATSSDDVTHYKTSLSAFGTRLSEMSGIVAKATIGNLANVKKNIATQLNPEFTMKFRVGNMVKIWDGNNYKPAKELKPVMAYPEFTEPTYEYLEEISQNFILPNVDKLPRNTITLLETNNRFIEAFLAGLNHEMARELLWREYPTDQRGSYFRQFWNTQDNLFEQDAEKKKDIEVMDKWTDKLGFHRPAGDKDILVLVVRGDLFKKYPDTMVYAQAASYDPADATKPRKLPSNITTANTKFPLFKASLKPDITLFGFDLTAEIANGDRITQPGESTAGKNPGWFFVFKERPGQIQFGLDDYTTETGDTTQMPGGKPETWNDLTWEHMVTQKTDLENYQLNFSKAISITKAADAEVKDKYLNEVPAWASNAAEVASILYQDPVLFARHAGEMLNEDLLNL